MVDPPPLQRRCLKSLGVSKKVEGVTKKVGGSGPPRPPQWLRPCMEVKRDDDDDDDDCYVILTGVLVLLCFAQKVCVINFKLVIACANTMLLNRCKRIRNAPTKHFYCLKS